MELRVWVDGTQRVVCGVKLTTTCQEIVFALAHATQQAGRFTMIERWRNNERLLSPNEQPLVTLQRWGDRMNEVEFILRKTSTDPLPPAQQQQQQTQHPMTNIQAQQQQAANNMPSQQHSSLQQAVTARTNTPAESTVTNHTSQTNGSNGHESPVSSHVAPIAHQTQPQQTQQLLSDQAHDNLYQQQRQFNLNRRPQTSLGPLTSSNSALHLTSNNLSQQQQINRVTNQIFRQSLSSSALPNKSNIGAVAQSVPMMASRYANDKSVSPSLYNGTNSSHNGYQLRNETVRYQQNNTNQISKNYPYEDLYSTINKKQTIQPPAVPAKPKLMSNIPHPKQPINNAQMNYYHPGQSPLHMYPLNLRPRHPPGYMEYLDAMSNRNSLPASLVPNHNFIHQTQGIQSNMYPRSSYDLHNQFYNSQQQHNGSMPPYSSNGNQFYYQANQQATRLNYGLGTDINQATTTIQNQMNPKLFESGIVINRGSAVNIKLPPNSQYVGHNQSSLDEQKHDNSIQSNVSSVSQMGMDMLKVIEEQKRVLLNQKNELERLDHDQEYFEAKQSSEQAELINLIEKEIAQLETLWRENQIQIRKLENQDFERELELLKAEQVRMEREIGNQKSKLARIEQDIVQCKSKIEQLETDVDSVDSDVDLDGDESNVKDQQEPKQEKVVSRNDSSKVNNDSSKFDLKSQKAILQSNGTKATSSHPLTISSDDEDDSGGDASDDLNVGDNPNGVTGRLRSAKDMAYVDKRGLISGLRSLKLDKTRAQNRSNDRLDAAENFGTKHNSSSPVANHLMHKDKSPDLTTNDTAGASNGNYESNHSETNGQTDANSTASSNNNNINNKNNNNNNNTNSNKYEFLLTL